MESNLWEDIRDGGEHALVNTEHERGNTVGTNGRLAFNAFESKVSEVTDERIGTVAEGERITPEEPLSLEPVNRRLDRQPGNARTSKDTTPRTATER